MVSRAIFKIRTIDHKNADLFLFLRVVKPVLPELKPHYSVVNSTIVLCLFSKQTGKEENFSPQQFPGNDIFLMFLVGLANDTF